MWGLIAGPMLLGLLIVGCTLVLLGPQLTLLVNYWSKQGREVLSQIKEIWKSEE